jgi:hypothetical protein
MTSAAEQMQEVLHALLHRNHLDVATALKECTQFTLPQLAALIADPRLAELMQHDHELSRVLELARRFDRAAVVQLAAMHLARSSCTKRRRLANTLAACELLPLTNKLDDASIVRTMLLCTAAAGRQQPTWLAPLDTMGNDELVELMKDWRPTDVDSISAYRLLQEALHITQRKGVAKEDFAAARDLLTFHAACLATRAHDLHTSLLNRRCCLPSSDGLLVLTDPVFNLEVKLCILAGAVAAGLIIDITADELKATTAQAVARALSQVRTPKPT